MNTIVSNVDRVSVLIKIIKNHYVAQLYPLTYNSIEILHAGGKTMASILQNLEASIFNNIAPKKSKYYFTLFDTIYFTDDVDRGDLIRQIEDKFASYGIKPQVS